LLGRHVPARVHFTRNGAVLSDPDLRSNRVGQDQRSDVGTSHCWITSLVGGSPDRALGIPRTDDS